MTFFAGDTLVHRLDPRVKVVGCGLLVILVAVSQCWGVVGISLVTGLALLLSARLSRRGVVRRFVRLNVFMAFVLGVLCVTIPGEELWRWWVLSVTSEGLARGGLIALKANTIVLWVTVLIGTIEVVSLGHALSHLKVPGKLIQIFLFTVRYIDVLHHERLKLSRAMKMRGFKAKLNGHTMRSLGYLLGMMLVRSLERSERIYAAMKCRGFKGHFYIFGHFAMKRNDYVFLGIVIGFFMAMFSWEWIWQAILSV
ncbi:MAG: cobalt ECF transporter T component CbiQ [Planctomycetes bacterium]|nr:cobalt ECF transporter T component CbiQ [Planctomycetota bacterium]